jgi:hypothetical protein
MPAPAQCRRPGRPKFFLAWPALLLLAPLARAEDALGALMQKLAGRPHAHATFTEKQYLALLERPLESSGELYFTPPDRLEKRTLLPKPESLVVEHDTLVLKRGKRQMSVALKSYPQLAPLVEGIRATLAGDRAALERVFEVQLASHDEQWSLALVPRDTQVAHIVARLNIAGRADEVASVETLRADGDRSLMSITPQAGP